jgi:hypothetical protein
MGHPRTDWELHGRVKRVRHEHSETGQALRSEATNTSERRLI